jgi:phosphatidate phosphatase APP1
MLTNSHIFVGDVYYGSVAEWIFQNRKGIRKFENFNIMLQNDISSNRNCEYILIGDTGEKDEEVL